MLIATLGNQIAGMLFDQPRWTESKLLANSWFLPLRKRLVWYFPSIYQHSPCRCPYEHILPYFVPVSTLRHTIAWH